VGLARIKAGEKGDLGYAIGEADEGFAGGKGLGLKGEKKMDFRQTFVGILLKFGEERGIEYRHFWAEILSKVY
jgi:hypothetical protein